MLKQFSKNYGFTLVELLVAIIIVSAVSTIGVASYTGYVRESRDSARISALSQIKGYLDQYYSANSKYPDCASCLSNSGQRVWITGLDSYSTNLPIDPQNEQGSPLDGKYSFLYRSYNSGQSYDLIGLLEDQNDPYRCEAIKYRGGESDNDLLCPPDASASRKRLVELSKGLSLVAQTDNTGGGGGGTTPRYITSVETLDAIDITNSSAKLRGKWSSNLEFPQVTLHRFYYSKNANISSENSSSVEFNFPRPSGEFNANISNLEAGTRYYYRIYMTINGQVYDGGVKTFTTSGGTQSPSGGGPVQTPSSSPVTTKQPQAITQTSAILYGSAEGPGNIRTPMVTARSLCYSLSENLTSPTCLSSPLAPVGLNLGDFSVSATGLTPNTRYYVRAQAEYVNSATDQRVSYNGSVVQFTTASSSITPPQPGDPTPNIVVSLVDQRVTDIGNLSATLRASVVRDSLNQVTGYRFCYSKDRENAQAVICTPVVRRTGTGEFEVLLNNLTNNTTYFYNAEVVYVVNPNQARPEAVIKSSIGTFRTSDRAVASGATNITSFSATLNSNFYINDAAVVGSVKKACYSKQRNFDNLDSASVTCTTIPNPGNNPVTVSGLEPSTNYFYVSTVLLSSNGVRYTSNISSFTTLATTDNVVVTTLPPLDTDNGLSLFFKGKIVRNVGNLVSKGRFCWSGNRDFSTSFSCTSPVDISTDGTFTSFLNDRLLNTPIYYRAEAVLRNGSSVPSLSIQSMTPGNRVITLTSENITDRSAVLKGVTVFFDNSYLNSPRQICYSMRYINPASPVDTAGLTCATNQNPMGYEVLISSLVPNTQYYYFAYIRLPSGDRYQGEVKTFRTLPLSAPTLTISPSNILSNSALLTTSVSNLAARQVIFRHICLRTSSNFSDLTSPLGAPGCFIAGGSDNNFSYAATGLTPSTQYFARGYLTTMISATRESSIFSSPVVNFRTQQLPMPVPSPARSTTISISNTTPSSVLLNGTSLGFNGVSIRSGFCIDRASSSSNIVFQPDDSRCRISFSSTTFSDPYNQLIPGSSYAAISMVRVLNSTGQVIQTVTSPVSRFTLPQMDDDTATLTLSTSASSVSYTSVIANVQLRSSSPNVRVGSKLICISDSTDFNNFQQGQSSKCRIATQDTSVSNFSLALNRLTDTDSTTLEPGKTYYLVARAQLSNRIFTSPVVSFRTIPLPSSAGLVLLLTNDATNVEVNSATLNGKLEWDSRGGGWVETRFCYSTSFSNFESTKVCTPRKSFSSVFSEQVSNLSPNTIYYYRSEIFYWMDIDRSRPTVSEQFRVFKTKSNPQSWSSRTSNFPADFPTQIKTGDVRASTSDTVALSGSFISNADYSNVDKKICISYSNDFSELFAKGSGIICLDSSKQNSFNYVFQAVDRTRTVYYVSSIRIGAIDFIGQVKQIAPYTPPAPQPTISVQTFDPVVNSSTVTLKASATATNSQNVRVVSRTLCVSPSPSFTTISTQCFLGLPNLLTFGDFSKAVSSLTPGSYFFRPSVITTSGTSGDSSSILLDRGIPSNVVTTGPTKSFTISSVTPPSNPTLTTLDAKDVSSMGAYLRGKLNLPQGQSISNYRGQFCYGTSSSNVCAFTTPLQTLVLPEFSFLSQLDYAESTNWFFRPRVVYRNATNQEVTLDGDTIKSFAIAPVITINPEVSGRQVRFGAFIGNRAGDNTNPAFSDIRFCYATNSNLSSSTCIDYNQPVLAVYSPFYTQSVTLQAGTYYVQSEVVASYGTYSKRYKGNIVQFSIN